MCGICGFYGLENKELLKSMNKSLYHRGPDDEGYFFDRKIGLGIRRLSIIDLSTGKQPIHNEDKSIWIVFNGEIYNFMEIAEKLEKKGHRFYTKTDTEVIIHAYEEYGPKCLELFNGMFAFAIWDTSKKKLFIARDRIGIKPLYYYFDGKIFLFASEIKALLKYQIKKTINEKSLYYYLNYAYSPRNQTIFNEIKKLEPGHYIELSDSKLKICRYWKIDFSNKTINNEDFFVKKIREHLDLSVKRRLIADVPVGAFLSGGLDSSAIVAYIKKYKENLKTFSIKFDDVEFDESKYAELVSEKFQTQHLCYNFTPKDVIKTIPFVIKHYDEPFADPVMIPSYLLAKITRKYVTVSLSGDGADESFLGYDRYRHFKLLGYQKIAPRLVNKSISQTLRYINKVINNSKVATLKNYFYFGDLEDYQKYSDLRTSVPKDLRQDLFLQKYEFADYYKSYFTYKHYLDNASNFDINVYLPGTMLTKLDLSTMAVSLEGRVPFLDHKFIEFSASIPANLKLKNFETKYILKKAMMGILPKEIIYRKKQGFAFPLKNYIRNQLKDYIRNDLTENSTLHKYVNKSYISKILNMHYKKQRDYTNLIWPLFVLKKWFDFNKY